MRPHDIAVNASVVGDRPSGLGRYALELIGALQKLDGRVTVHRSDWPWIRRDRGLARHALRLLWCQTTLRLATSGGKASVLLNPVPEGVLFTRVPQVTVLHDLIPLAFPAQYPRQQWYFRRFVPAMLRKSRMVVAISRATSAQAMQTYGLAPERIRIVPSACDLQRFRPDGPAVADGGVPYVLFVGTLLPHKNLPRLVEAVAIAGRRTALRLVIAGHGAPGDIARLQARAKDSDVSIELRSYVPFDELPALYRGARVVVVPSLAEGFGLTALEAMASGTPVIVSNTTSLPEVVGEAGLRVDPQDSDAIAEAIVAVLTDDALHKDLSARGLTRAATFSWERTAREMLDVLRAVTAA